MGTPFRSTVDGFQDNGNQNFGHGGHLGFVKMSYYWLLRLGDQIKLRFALQSTVFDITAIKISVMAAILDFSETAKVASSLFFSY